MSGRGAPKGVPSNGAANPSVSRIGDAADKIVRRYRSPVANKAAKEVWKALDQMGRSEAFARAGGPIVIAKYMEMISTGHYTIEYRRDGEIHRESIRLDAGDLKGLVLYGLPFALGVPRRVGKEGKPGDMKGAAGGRRGKGNSQATVEALREAYQGVAEEVAETGGEGSGLPGEPDTTGEE